MDRLQYLRRCVTAFAGVAVFTIPGTGKAQTVTISSIAQATCVGAGDCSRLRFAIDLSGAMNSSRLRLFSNDRSVWPNAGLIGVSDGSGSTLQWFGSATGGEFTIESSGPRAPEAVFVTTRMDTHSGLRKPRKGSLGHDVRETRRTSDHESEPAVREDMPDNPVATPEPGTMLLLGTGLVGVVGARRRRRRELTG